MSGNILGLSAALEELGTNPERGASSIGRLVQTMSEPENVVKFAEAIGMSSEEFKNLVNNNPNEALLVFAQRVVNGNQSSTELAGTLDELGLTGVGINEVLKKVGENTDLVRKNQELANGALDNATSIQDEYNIKNETGQANLQKFQNSLETTKKTIGESLAPALNSLIGFLQPVIDGFTNFAENNPEIVTVLLILTGGIVGLIAVLGVLATAVTVAGIAMTVLTGPLGIVTIAIGAVLLLIGALVAGFVWLYNESEAFRNKVSEAMERIKTVIDERLRPAWESLMAKLREFWAEHGDKITAIAEAIGNAFVDYIVWGVEKTIESIEQLINWIEAMINKFNAGINKAKEFFKSLPEPVQKFVVQQATGRIGTGFKDGGYTGDGDPNQIAGAVHKGEFVMDHQIVDKIGVDNMYALADLLKGSDSSSVNDNRDMSTNQTFNNYGFATSDFY